VQPPRVDADTGKMRAPRFLVRRLVITFCLVTGPIVGLAQAANATVLGGVHDPVLPRPIQVTSGARAGTRILLVRIERDLTITARFGDGPVVGSLPAASRFYRSPALAWVRRTSPDGRFGLVDVPYSARPRSGWIALRGLERTWTRVRVIADLSEHRITVRRGGVLVFRTTAGTGGPASPTPVGRYVVADRVAFPAGGPLGTFAFGISGIQPNLPAGWTGGDQLAIHGTNAPATIGRSASAGCLRVSESALARLKPLLRIGTPVVVRA
jgi:lipoprotein-anchoring transpeptidase ErfK/SrfK